MAWKGIIARSNIVLDQKGNYWLEWVLVARNGHLLSIISMMVSDRRLSMWLELFVCKLHQRACEIKDASTDLPPTVSVFLFDRMNVTINNLIIFTPVQLVILIMATNVPADAVHPLPARKPFYQALAWVVVLTRRVTATSSTIKAD